MNDTADTSPEMAEKRDRNSAFAWTAIALAVTATVLCITLLTILLNDRNTSDNNSASVVDITPYGPETDGTRTGTGNGQDQADSRPTGDDPPPSEKPDDGCQTKLRRLLGLLGGDQSTLSSASGNLNGIAESVGAYLQSDCDPSLFEETTGIDAEDWPEVEQVLLASSELLDAVEATQTGDIVDVSVIAAAVEAARTAYENLPEKLAPAAEPVAAGLLNQMSDRLLLLCAAASAVGCPEVLEESAFCSQARLNVAWLDQSAADIEVNSPADADTYLDAVNRAVNEADKFAFVGCSPLVLSNLVGPVDVADDWAAVKPYLSKQADLEHALAYIDHFGVSISTLDRLVPALVGYAASLETLPPSLLEQQGVGPATVAALRERADDYCGINPRIRGCAQYYASSEQTG